jgi:very-short-patch-repair endonuclease
LSQRKQKIAEHLLDNMTWPEKILWSRLRHRQIGYSFQRQAVVFGYIVDFWCSKAKVAIELDGSVHDGAERTAYDFKRDDQLRRHGVEVLRFRNSDLFHGMSAVILRIWDACYRRFPIVLKPFPLESTPVRSRYSDSVEMRALRTHKEQLRLEEHAKRFGENYRKKRGNPVYFRKKAQ